MKLILLKRMLNQWNKVTAVKGIETPMNFIGVSIFKI